jgi:hypothetical protein
MTGRGGGKQRRRRMETPYSRISEIKEASTQEGANDLLRQGFILVKVMERFSADSEKQTSSIVYVLGRQNPNGQSHPAHGENGHPPTRKPTAPSTSTAVLERLPWKKYSNGGGEWAFYMDRDEDLLPELEGARELIARMKGGEEIVAGNHVYRIKDKFMKRFPYDGGTGE